MRPKTVGGYLSEVWRSRYFWLSLVRLDLRSRYRRSVLGIGWSLVQPLGMTAVMCFVFSTVFKQSIVDYAPSVLTGLAFWSFISASVNGGTFCMTIAEPYIRQYPAPIAIYPMRIVLAAAVHFTIALSVAMLLSFGFRGISNPLPLVSLIPFMLLTLVLGWSITTLVGISSVYFPDIKHISEVVLQFLFYMTPIIIPMTFLRENNLQKFFALNPLTWFLTLLRNPVLEGAWPPLVAFAVPAATTVALAGLAVWMLVKCERRLIFHL